MTQKYKIYCKKCKQKTLHIIVQISRNRGVKLSCLNCSTETRWVNAKNLKE